MGEQWVGSVRGGPGGPTRGRSVENFLGPGGLRGPPGGWGPRASVMPPGWGASGLATEYGSPSMDLLGGPGGPGGQARRGIERSKSFSQGGGSTLLGSVTLCHIPLQA